MNKKVIVYVIEMKLEHKCADPWWPLIDQPSLFDREGARYHLDRIKKENTGGKYRISIYERREKK